MGVIAEIAEIDSTIEMTTVIIIETTMVKIVLKVIGDQDQHLHSETMIVIAEIDTIPLGIAEASAIVADTTDMVVDDIQMSEMIVVITEVMVSVVIEAMIEEITEMVAVMIVIAEMEEDITGETIVVVMIAETIVVVMIAEVDIIVIEDLQNVMVMIPQRRDQGYNCKNVLLPWNPHPHLPVLLFLVAQNQLTPRKKNEKLKKNCKNNKK